MTLVRPACPEDAPGIAEVHVRAWQGAYRGIMPDAFLDRLETPDRAAAWRRRLEGPLEIMLVVEIDGRIAGWAMGGHSRDADAGAGTAELYAINLDPGVWRRGAGRMLCQAAHEAMRLRAYTRATLWVLEGNTRARAFYAALGYHEDPTLAKTSEFGGATLRELRYVMEL